MQKLAPALATLLFFLAGPATATSFFPYSEQCIPDANGRYYVVVKRKDDNRPYGAVTLTIAERRAGTPPVRRAAADEMDRHAENISDPRIRVRDGDLVHGRIELAQPPGQVFVSATGKGVVTLDVYGFNTLGEDAGKNDVVVYSLKGEVVHRKARSELFDAAARRHFHYIDGNVAWYTTAWLDERRDELVIVGLRKEDETPPRRLLTVGIVSGNVRPTGFEVIDRAITERNLPALSDALDLANELRLTGSKASWLGLVEDETAALDHRLRAVVLMASFGSRRGAWLMSRTALLAIEERAGSETFEQWAEVDYAIRHLPDLLGEDALPALKKTLRANGSRYNFAHTAAFRALGGKSVPTLVTVLEDDRNFDAQLEAATCLGYLGPAAEPAVPALIKALHKKTTKQWGLLNLRLDAHAAWALEHIGERAKAAIPDLEQLAKDGDEFTQSAARSALAAIRKESARP